MDLETLYRSTVESWSRRVAGIAADQWDLATPCSDWSVRDLVNHVVGEDLWTPPVVAGNTIEEVGDQFDGDLLGADPISTAQTAAADAITATLGALPSGRIVHLSFGDTPMEEYVWQLVGDHLVHEWDLAAAIGAPRGLDPVAVDEVARWFATWEDVYRGAGAIGPRQPLTGADSDPQSALLVASGRNPSWAADTSG